MGLPLVVLGDSTSHRGTVISAAPASTTGGKRFARMGDMVACPRCKGVFPISQGDASLIVDGAPAAYHGCGVACGASLVSSQVATSTLPSGGGAPGATDAMIEMQSTASAISVQDWLRVTTKNRSTNSRSGFRGASSLSVKPMGSP